MATVTLAPRKESPERWDTNRDINEMIAQAFKKSVKSFNGSSSVVSGIISGPKVREILTISSPYLDTVCGEILYGGKKMSETGCAIFCLHQGLEKRLKDEIDIAELAQEVEAKGYYEPGKGTYHNLLDHIGLRRATDCAEVLMTSSMCTMLVKNDKYHGDPNRKGNHYVNVVGFNGDMAIIDDPVVGRKSILVKDLFAATIIAWMW